MTSTRSCSANRRSGCSIIVHKGREAEVEAHLRQWESALAEMAWVTDTGPCGPARRPAFVPIFPPQDSPDESPVYQREAKEPEYLKGVRDLNSEVVRRHGRTGGHLRSVAEWRPRSPKILGVSPTRVTCAR